MAQDRWDDYSAARDEMLTRTHTAVAPWWCARADDKAEVRLSLISHLLRTVAAPGLSDAAIRVDPAVLFAFELAALSDGRLAR